MLALGISRIQTSNGDVINIHRKQYLRSNIKETLPKSGPIWQPRKEQALLYEPVDHAPKERYMEECGTEKQSDNDMGELA
jgi:hypothetical protein